MKMGFDVCLHNKRLDLQVGGKMPPPVAEPDKAATAITVEPNAVWGHCSKWTKRYSQQKTWQDYTLLFVAFLHCVVLALDLLPLQLGAAVRSVCLILSPCTMTRELDVYGRGSALVLHLAAVWSLVVTPDQQQHVNGSFYVASVLILSTQVFTRPKCSKLQLYITLFACLGLVATLTLKLVSALKDLELLLDQCCLSMAIIVYCTNIIL